MAPNPAAQGLHKAGHMLARSSHPELEDDSMIEMELKKCGRSKESRARVDVLECNGVNITWKRNLDNGALEKTVNNHVASGEKVVVGTSKQALRVFFLDTSKSEDGWLPGTYSIHPRTLQILQEAGLSSIVVDAIFAKESSWSKMGNQCFVQNEDTGSLLSFEVAYRYVCGWGNGFAFTQSIRTKHQNTYFCINYPPRALERFEAQLKANPSCAHRDYIIDTISADESLKQWQATIGKYREQLRHYEKLYNGEEIEFNKATRELHNLAYIWHSLGQDCTDNVLQLQFMSRAYKKYIARLQDPKNAWDFDKSIDMSEVFDALESQCENSARWTSVYRQRTKLRINLLFHLAAQRDSRTSTEIAKSTSKVAEQTQRDSASMITMATVTTIFLPGTFISAVLSTTVFDYGDNAVGVSKEWWILPASMIPMTMILTLLWYWWMDRRRKRFTRMNAGAGDEFMGKGGGIMADKRS